MDSTKNFESNSRILGELVVALRFGVIGILATAIHIAVVWLLLSTSGLPTLLANTIAFINACGISFTGNYFWTFGAPGAPRRALCRFLTISISAFFLNSLLLSAILQLQLFSPPLAASGSAAVIPLITFLASRFWGFKSNKSPSR